MAGGLELCADCDTVNPRWASVNRGVLLCEDCSAIHRQLGRHVSQIKHLTKSRWRESLLVMVRQLSSAGVNKYWEHILLEPSTNGQHSGKHLPVTRSSRKPAPNDPAHPNKAEFIKEKYLFMAFFKRPSHYKQNDLDHQLHASVRTSVLETSLYLLALGANPNFVHPVKRTSPLHVAVQYNQITQVELLITYGANILSSDNTDVTPPLQIAMQNSQLSGKSSWTPLVECLIQSQYEICDSFSYYLSRQVADHRNTADHFFIPRLPADSIDNGAGAVEAKKKLQHLSNEAFLNLCIDVYDEVERRETNQIRQSLRDHHQQKNDDLLLFLPPHREYSSTRNQGRQKLGRFGIVEFNTLVLDVLIEAKCRMQVTSLSGSSSIVSVVSRGRHSMLVMASHSDHSSKESSQMLHQSGKSGAESHANHGDAQNHRRNSLPGLSVGLDDDFAPVYDYVPNDSDYGSVFDSDDKPPDKEKVSSTTPSTSRKRPVPPVRTTPLQSSTDINSNKTSASVCQHVFESKSPINSRKHQESDVSTTFETDDDQSIKIELRDLLNRVEDLEARNKLLEARNKELEERSKRLEQKMFVIKSEKESLLNAMSITQSASSKDAEDNSSTTPITVHQRRRRDLSGQPPSNRKEPPVLPRRSSSGSNIPPQGGDHQEKSQDINVKSRQVDSPANRIARREIKSGGLVEIRESEKRNNYALGSESFNTGVLLRQEILQRGPSNERRERPISQHNHPLNSKRGPTPDQNERFVPPSDSVEKDNYMAPSSTGFQSPVPRGSSPAPRTYSPTPNDPLTVHPVSIVPTPPSHKMTSVRSPDPQRKILVDKQSSQAHVKFFQTPATHHADLALHKERDYDDPPDDSDMSNCLPHTERVVKGVDAITVQIRTLLEVANHKHQSDFLRCSRNIQAAVQSMIALFPPSYRRGQGHIGLPLNALSTHARELRRHCENRGSNWSPQGEELTTLIHHAHEIAKSAKQLLSLLQKSNRGQTSRV